jgi:hypothetical protein
MNPEIKRLEERLQALKDQRRIDRLKREIAEIDGDPKHPASEGWEWDSDLGWEQPKGPPIEHIDV